MLNQYSNHKRDYGDLKYVYPVISRRSAGLSLGINLNVDKLCNFDCPYCQVDRRQHSDLRFDQNEFQKELVSIIKDIRDGTVWKLPRFKNVENINKKFKDVAIAGDGEPSTSPYLLETMGYLQKISEEYSLPEIVWISNATGLAKSQTLQSLRILEQLKGTIWAKLDAGSQEYFELISASKYNLDRIQSMIEKIPAGVKLKIQSCFMKVEGSPPSPNEIDLYISRLMSINQNRNIAEVQIYTIARKPAQNYVSPLKLTEMHNILAPIKETNLPVKFYSGAAD
ncbi:MAG: radical SAM protein [bacterium]|nr:radical SAM protein [bacterium]